MTFFFFFPRQIENLALCGSELPLTVLKMSFCVCVGKNILVQASLSERALDSIMLDCDIRNPLNF